MKMYLFSPKSQFLSPKRPQFLAEKRYLFSFHFVYEDSSSETVFLNAEGAQESIPPAYVAWRAGTPTLFLLGSWPPIDYSKIPAPA
jgi:hypothetical protein